MAAMRRRRRPAEADAADGDGTGRVVVVGAGFGGLATMRRLARAGARTTLVDRNVYSTFQPLLYQVATAGLTSSDVAYPARGVTRKYHARFRRGDLTGIDPALRQITLADGTKLGYDYLILATGVVAAYHGIAGGAEHSLGLYTRRDAIVLRDHILASVERLSMAGPSRDLAVTVIGGGATGVELAGTLAERPVQLSRQGHHGHDRAPLRLLSSFPAVCASAARSPGSPCIWSPCSAAATASSRLSTCPGAISPGGAAAASSSATMKPPGLGSDQRGRADRAPEPAR